MGSVRKCDTAQSKAHGRGMGMNEMFRARFIYRSGHVFMRLFVKGAFAGPLTMRVEEFERFRAQAKFIEFIDETPNSGSKERA